VVGSVNTLSRPSHPVNVYVVRGLRKYNPGVGMSLNLLTALIVSRLILPPPSHIQAIVDSIRIPRGAGEALDE
jgi:hypothetical protein